MSGSLGATIYLVAYALGWVLGWWAARLHYRAALPDLPRAKVHR